MPRVLLLLLGMLLLASGCKQYAALTPLADPDQPVYDNQLLGRWCGMQTKKDPATGATVNTPDTDNYFTVTKNRNRKTGYTLSAVNKRNDTTIDFDVRPFEVGDHKFLQLQRPKFGSDEENAGILRIYYFAPYEIEDDKLYISFTPTDRLRKLAKAEDIAMVETKQTLLFTSERQQMLDFLDKHMEELFPDGKATEPLYRAESFDQKTNNDS